MAVDRATLLLVVFPLLVLASDLYTLLILPPQSHHHHQSHVHQPQPSVDKVLPVISQLGEPIRQAGRVDILFCSSCSYKQTAIQTRNVLANLFPGIEVRLSNYPPPLIKRLMIKLVPLFQFSAIALALGGDHIFPRLGYASPPFWYNRLRQNRFGTVATCWLLGNVLQNVLQSTGAFEVYLDGDLIFSKLKEKRFPAEFELRDLITRHKATLLT